MKELKNKDGFTLVEMIIYIAIFSIFIGTLVSFFITMNSSRINNQITLEVNNQGNDVMRVMTQSIRNATSINTPSTSSLSNTLSLVTPDLSKNPTIFSVTDGILYMTEGSGPSISLTNDKVSLSNLVFSNLSNPNTLGSVQVRFTLTSTILNTNSVFKNVDFYGSGSIKK